MKAFVAGATGQTGRRIVQELTRRQIPVRALVRDVNAARSSLPAGVELVEGDVLQPGSLSRAIGDSTVLLCATGAKPGWDIRAPYSVDYQGTKNLMNAAQTAGINHFVLVSSLGASNFFHPLNLFWLVLYWKKRAEEALQSSGLTYTIVRPGGLTNDDSPDSIVMKSADTYMLFGGRIARQKVAQVCVEALFEPTARNKTVEIIAEPDAPTQTFAELFGSVGDRQPTRV